MSLKTLDLKQSNSFMERLIKNDKPFSITRIGSPEVKNCYSVLTKQKIDQKSYDGLENNAGVYNLDNNGRKKYGEMYGKAIINSDALATFEKIMPKEQLFFIKEHGIIAIHSRIVEPFYCCLSGIKPWSLKLHGKKVLIISPFTDSMKKQIDAGFRIFKDKDVFHPEQEFIFYKCYQSVAGNKPHKDWFETFNIMCKEIKKLDFDIALLGCGGYGLPLCDFIKKDMKKSAIYVGGGLQLLFGIMGKRWEKQNNGLWEKIIKENDLKMIRPSGDEIPKNCDNVEEGCYW